VRELLQAISYGWNNIDERSAAEWRVGLVTPRVLLRGVELSAQTVQNFKFESNI